MAGWMQLITVVNDGLYLPDQSEKQLSEMVRIPIPVICP